MEKMLTDLLLLIIVLGGAKVLLFHLLGKTKYEMAAVRDNKTGKIVSIGPKIDEHYKYIYSQNEIYGSMYPTIQSKFKLYMQSGALNSEQVKFIERYLRNELNDHKSYKNNAHAIYSMLKSPLLDNQIYQQIDTILEDFTHRK